MEGQLERTLRETGDELAPTLDSIRALASVLDKSECFEELNPSQALIDEAGALVRLCGAQAKKAWELWGQHEGAMNGLLTRERYPEHAATIPGWLVSDIIVHLTARQRGGAWHREVAQLGSTLARYSLSFHELRPGLERLIEEHRDAGGDVRLRQPGSADVEVAYFGLLNDGER